MRAYNGLFWLLMRKQESFYAHLGINRHDFKTRFIIRV